MPNINWLELAVDFGVLLLFAIAGGLCLWRAVRRPAKGPACPKCFYSMQMTQSLTCPECGYSAASPKDFTKRVIKKRWLVPAVVLLVPPVFGLWVVAVYYPQGIREQVHYDRLRKIESEGNRLKVIANRQGTPNSSPRMRNLRRMLGMPIYHLRQHGVHTPYHSLSNPAHLPDTTRWITYMFDYMEQPAWHLQRHTPTYHYTCISLLNPLPSDLEAISKCRSVEDLNIAISKDHLESDKIKPEDFLALSSITSLTKLSLNTQVNGRIADILVNANPGLHEFTSGRASSVTDETLKALGRCQKLTRLNLGNMSAMTDAGFIGLCGSRSIENLVASRLSVSPEAFAAIAQVKTLKEIKAHDVTFSDQHIPPLKQLENLEKIEIHSNAVTGITDVSSLIGFHPQTILEVVHAAPRDRTQGKGGFERAYVKWFVRHDRQDMCGTGLNMHGPGDFSLYLTVGDKTTPENLSQLAGLKNVGSLSMTLGKTTRLESLTFLRSMPDIVEVNLGIDTREVDKNGLNSLLDHLVHSEGISSLGINSQTITQDMIDVLGSSKARLNRITLGGQRPDWLDFSPLTRGEGFEFFMLDATFQATASDLQAIARIPRLKELYVSGKFTKDDLKPLFRSSTLRKVIWIGGGLTDQDISDFKQQRPDLEVFAFQH